MTRVFVYGTLRPGERNAEVAARGGPFGAVPARLTGFRLLHLSPEAYPGIVPGPPDGVVVGEVLTYAPRDWPRALLLLDALEGVHDTPPLYRRAAVTVTLEGGASQAAWTYVYADADRLTRPGAVLLPGGDWRAWPDRERPGVGER
nr:gamma-glutamylcyclotransferase family protein [Deinococcus budaensis]